MGLGQGVKLFLLKVHNTVLFGGRPVVGMTVGTKLVLWPPTPAHLPFRLYAVDVCCTSVAVEAVVGNQRHRRLDAEKFRIGFCRDFYSCWFEYPYS